MIVYNVGRRWFTMKHDAEAQRRADKLPPGATFTLRIDSREDLAALLNGLCGVPADETPGNAAPENPAPATVLAANEMLVPDCVPRFLLNDWTRQKLIPANGGNAP